MSRHPLVERGGFELRVRPTATEVFMFSAVTWNRHQIHFNQAQARAEGFQDVVVQRGLLGNYLARLVTEWAGAEGRLERLQWKVSLSAFPGQELRCVGEVTEVMDEGGGQLASCAVKIINAEGAQVASGEAKVRLIKC